MNTDTTSFSADLLRQDIGKHIAAISTLGYQPEDISGNAKRLRDLYCSATDTYFECKEDSHSPRNLCIELMGNLRAMPHAQLNRPINPQDTSAYAEVLSFMRLAWQDERNYALGLSKDLESNHLLSYSFKCGATYLMPIDELQMYVVLPALRDGSYPLVIKRSSGSGRDWYAISMLIPIADVAKSGTEFRKVSVLNC